jgi:transcriptional regulator with XRE-family HTH domain
MLLARKKLIEYINKQKSKKNGWTQTFLAEQVGCSKSYISDLLNGKKERPSIRLAKQLEVVTKVVKIQDWSKYV